MINLNLKPFKIASFFNNKFAKFNEHKSEEIRSPENNALIAQFVSLSKQDVTNIYNDASIAFNSWKDLDYKKRILFVRKFQHKLIKNKEELARLICISIAKPYTQALDEVNRTIQLIDDLIAVYKKEFVRPIIFGKKELKTDNKKGIWTYSAIGVVLAIAPFNYPLNLLISKIIPALLTGNTVCYKSAKTGLIIGYIVAKYFKEIKLPNGVINFLVVNDQDALDELVSNKHIALLNFTGGTKTGEAIAKKLPWNANKVLELGGMDAALITKNNQVKNINNLVKEIIKGAFSFNGQRCTAIKRVILLKDNEEYNDLFLKNLIEQVKKLKLGNSLQDADITSLISNDAVSHIKELYHDAIAKGANQLVQWNAINNIVEPIIINNVNKTMRIYSEEPFGPILPIIYANDIDEMIQISNDTKYGLQASIFSENESEWNEIKTKINTGSVNWNKASSRGPDVLPFLGVKESGFNVQGVYYSLLSTVTLKGYIENK